MARAKEGLDQLVARMESRVHAAEADARAARADAALVAAPADAAAPAVAASSVAAPPAAWVEEKQGVEAALAAATRELDHAKSAWEAEKAAMQTLLHREEAARQTELAKERQALWGQVRGDPAGAHVQFTVLGRVSSYSLRPSVVAILLRSCDVFIGVIRRRRLLRTRCTPCWSCTNCAPR